MNIDRQAGALLEYLAGDLVAGRFVTGKQAVMKFASFVRTEEQARAWEIVRDQEGDSIADEMVVRLTSPCDHARANEGRVRCSNCGAALPPFAVREVTP